jgi:hypothetical protein
MINRENALAQQAQDCMFNSDPKYRQVFIEEMLRRSLADQKSFTTLCEQWLSMKRG